MNNKKTDSQKDQTATRASQKSNQTSESPRKNISSTTKQPDQSRTDKSNFDSDLDE